MSESHAPDDGARTRAAPAEAAPMPSAAPTPSDAVVTSAAAASTSDSLTEPSVMSFSIKGAAALKRQPSVTAPTQSTPRAASPSTHETVTELKPEPESLTAPPKKSSGIKIGFKAAVQNKPDLKPDTAKSSLSSTTKAKPMSIRTILQQAAKPRPAKPKLALAEPVSTSTSTDTSAQADATNGAPMSHSLPEKPGADPPSDPKPEGEIVLEKIAAAALSPPSDELEPGEVKEDEEEGPPRPPEMLSNLPAKPTELDRPRSPRRHGWPEQRDWNGNRGPSQRPVVSYGDLPYEHNGARHGQAPPMRQWGPAHDRMYHGESSNHQRSARDEDRDVPMREKRTIAQTGGRGTRKNTGLEGITMATMNLNARVADLGAADAVEAGVTRGIAQAARDVVIKVKEETETTTSTGKVEDAEIVLPLASHRLETIATERVTAVGTRIEIVMNVLVTVGDALYVQKKELVMPARSRSPSFSKQQNEASVKFKDMDTDDQADPTSKTASWSGWHRGPAEETYDGLPKATQRPETPSAPLPPRHAAGASEPASPDRLANMTGRRRTPNSRPMTQGRKSMHVPGDEPKRTAPQAFEAYEDPWLTQQANDGDSQSDDLNQNIPENERLAALAEMQARDWVGVSSIKEYTLKEMLGEGTFGVVWKGIRGREQVAPLELDEIKKKEEALVERGLKVRQGDIVALKQIILHNESDGMPITSLREIRILKALSHPNVVPVVDMAIDEGNNETMSPCRTYMVFPYMDHDLAGLLENIQVKLLPEHIKQYARQLLFGTEYLHLNGILHRDMKAANLLLNNEGRLMIADFGLARSIEKAEKRKNYTACVVTRWYRPPELLLGEVHYHTPVDMWGVGCVIAEMFTRKPIFAGSSDLDQADLIFNKCGEPSEETMPGFKHWPKYDSKKEWPSGRRTIGPDATGWANGCAEFGDLIAKLLEINPAKRLTARQALDHDWFWTKPLPCDPADLPKHMPSKEYDKRKRANEDAALEHMQQRKRQQLVAPAGGGPPPPRAVVPVPPGFGGGAPLPPQPPAPGLMMPGGMNGYGAPFMNGSGAPFARGGHMPMHHRQQHHQDDSRPSFLNQVQMTSSGSHQKVDMMAMMAGSRPGQTRQSRQRFSSDALQLDSGSVPPPNGARPPFPPGSSRPPPRRDVDKPADASNDMLPY
ncbi:hypothetical protein ACM66B_000268 [Microbotryomycetes sp. NB124-2]